MSYTLQLGVDSSKLTTSIDDVLTKYSGGLNLQVNTETIKEQLSGILKSETIDIGVKFDDSNVKTELDNTIREASKDSEVSVSANLDEAKSDISSFVGENSEHMVDIEAAVDTDEAKKEFEDLHNSTEDLSAVESVVTGDVSDATEKIEGLEQQQQSIENVVVEAEVDTTKAVDGLNKVETAAQDTKESLKNVGDDANFDEATRSAEGYASEQDNVKKRVDDTETSLATMGNSIGNVKDDTIASQSAMSQMVEGLEQVGTSAVKVTEVFKDNKASDGVVELATVTSQFADEQGRLYEIVEKTSTATGEQTESLSITKNLIQDTSSSLKALQSEYGEVVTVLDEVDEGMKFNKSTGSHEKITTQTVQFKDSQDNLRQAVVKTSTSMEGQTKIVSSQVKEIDETNTSLKKLIENFTQSATSMAKFFLITQGLQIFKQAMSEVVDVVIDMDAAMTDFNKVSDLSNDGLLDYIDTLTELGEAVARTGTQMLEAATKFVQSGYTEAESAQLAEIASLYQNVADAQVSAADAASFVISQMKAFGIEASDAISIIDKLNEVSNNFAVSSSDIASALTTTAAAMATYGNTIDETIALNVAGSEILVNQASKVARGLSSVGAEIVKTANNYGVLEYATKEGTRALELFGETGEMLSTFDVLQEIASDWNNMNDAQQSSIALQLGMKTQISTLSAVLENFGSATAAVNTSLTASGSAMKENEAYMESLEAKITGLKAAFESLVIGDGGISGILGILIDLGTIVLDLLDNKFVRFITMLAATSIAVSGLTTAMVVLSESGKLSWISTAIAGLGEYVVNIIFAETATKSLTAAINGLSASTGIGLLIMALPTLVSWYKNLNTTLSEQKSIVSDLSSLVSSLRSEYETLIAKDELTESESRRLALLEAQISANEVQLKQEAEKVFQAEYLSTKYREIAANALVAGRSFTSVTGASRVDAIEEDVQAYNNLTSEIENLSSQMDSWMEQRGEDGKLTEEAIAQINLLQEELDGLNQEYALLGGSLAEVTEELDTFASQGVDLSGLEGVYSSLKKIFDQAEDNVEAYENTMDSVEGMAGAHDEAVAAISAMGSSFDTVNNAIEEYNANGYLTTDTLSDLLSLGDEYISMLSIENGQLKMNAGAAEQLAQAQINEAKAAAIAEAQTKLNTIAAGNYSSVLTDMYNSSVTSANASKNAGSAAATSGQNALNAAADWQSFWAAVKDETNYSSVVGLSEAQKQAAKEVESQLQSTLAMYDSLSANIGSITKATGATNSNTSATNSNTSAIDANISALEAQKEALEDVADALQSELDNYEIVIDYVKDLIAEEQEAVEDERDAVLGAIQDKIDALEDEQEAFEKANEAKISALETERDSLVDPANDRIEALEAELEAIENTSEAQIEALEAERDVILDATDAIIDSLNERRDEVEAYWDDIIAAQTAENEAIEENIKLQQLQEALAKAQSSKVMVLQDGKFTYTTDESAVSSAADDLANYERELAAEAHLAELEALKADALASLDEQLAEHQSFRDATADNYNQQISDLENYVADAQKSYNEQIDNLSAYVTKTETYYNEQIADIESYVDEASALYDEQLADLKAYYDEVSIEYAARIAEYDAYLDEFQDMLDASAKAHAKTLYDELVGEADNWTDRMKNLSTFVANYDAKKNELEGIKSTIADITSQISALEAKANAAASGAASAAASAAASLASAQQSAKETSNVSKSFQGYKYYYTDALGSKKYSSGSYTTSFAATDALQSFLEQAKNSEIKRLSILKPYQYPSGYEAQYYATGTYGVGSDEIAFVGDDPKFQELAIGANYNKGMGVPMNLKKGTGIVPAKETNTLTKMLTEWARGGNNSYEEASANNGFTQAINIEKMVIDGVQTPDEFANALINKFKGYTIQKSYS